MNPSTQRNLGKLLWIISIPALIIGGGYFAVTRLVGLNTSSYLIEEARPIPNPHDFISPDEFCWAAGYDWSLGMHEIYSHLEEWICLDAEECVVKMIYRIDGQEAPWVETSCPISHRGITDYVWINRNYFSRFLEIDERLQDVCGDGTMEAILPIIDDPLDENRGRLIRTGWVFCQEGEDLVMRDGRRADHREEDRWKNIDPVPDQLRKEGLAHEAHFGIDYRSTTPN
jgi:hypothetical protein